MDGYGQAWYHGHRRQAHRLLAIWEHGDIPRSWEVDHTCRHRWCVEIAHLNPIPRAEHRRFEAERRHLIDEEPAAAADEDRQPSAPTASAPPSEALTVEQRRVAVQRLRAQGWSLRRIAEHLDISYGTVHSAAKEVINAENGVINLVISVIKLIDLISTHTRVRRPVPSSSLPMGLSGMVARTHRLRGENCTDRGIPTVSS
jgi:hypothetical protein